MADARQNRDTQTRTAVERKKESWSPPQVLPHVEEREGWTHRWIRTSLVSKADNTNVSSRFREGWEPVVRSDYPELQIMIDRDSRFPEGVEIGGLLLCKAPTEIMLSRSKYYQNQTDNAMAAVDNSLMKQNDQRMPLFKEGRSSVSFGGGKK